MFFSILLWFCDILSHSVLIVRTGFRQSPTTSPQVCTYYYLSEMRMFAASLVGCYYTGRCKNRRVTRACCVYLMRAVISAHAHRGAARNTIGSSAPGSYGWGVRQSEHLLSIFCAQYCTATQSRASPLCKLQGSVLWKIFTASFPLACLSKCRQAATKFLGDSVGATTSTAAKAGTSILSGVNGASHALASGIFASGQV